MFTFRFVATYTVLVGLVVAAVFGVTAVRSGFINHAAWEDQCSQFYPDGNWVVEDRTGNGRMCYSAN